MQDFSQQVLQLTAGSLCVGVLFAWKELFPTMAVCGCLPHIVPHWDVILCWLSSATARGKNLPHLMLVSAPGLPVLLKTAWDSKARPDANRESEIGYFLLSCTSASLLGVCEGVGTIALGIAIYAQSLLASRGVMRVKHYGEHSALCYGNPPEIKVKYCTQLFKLG